MLRIKLSTEAESDIDQGIRYYNRQGAGLGRTFLAAVSDTFKKIQHMPEAASFVFDNTRYKKVASFPYIILYEVNDANIRVIRVFNTFLDSDAL